MVPWVVGGMLGVFFALGLPLLVAGGAFSVSSWPARDAAWAGGDAGLTVMPPGVMAAISARGRRWACRAANKAALPSRTDVSWASMLPTRFESVFTCCWPLVYGVGLVALVALGALVALDLVVVAVVARASRAFAVGVLLLVGILVCRVLY